MKLTSYPFFILFTVMLQAATAQTDAPFYMKGRQLELSNNWEAAYDAYVLSIEKKESVNAEEDDRAIDLAFTIATEHLGRFDDAIELVNKYLKENTDGYAHRFLGYFYQTKLHKFDKAREHYKLSSDDYRSAGRMSQEVRSIIYQADAYRDELYEMEYYANRKNQQSYTRKAHELFLRAFELNDGSEIESDRIWARNYILKALAGIYEQSWYSGKNPELAKEYRQKLEEYKQGEVLNAHQKHNDEYSKLYRENKWAEGAQLIEKYLQEFPYQTNNEFYIEQLVMCYRKSEDWENTLRVANIAMNLIDLKINSFVTDIEKSLSTEHDWLATYERAIIAAEKLGRHDIAFDIMERSHARAMLDLISGRDYSKREERLSKDDKEITLLKSRINQIKDAIEQERKLQRPEDLASLQRSLVVVEDTSSRIQRRADIARREIFSTTHVEPVTTEEARKLIGDGTLITFFDGIYISVITKDHVYSSPIRGSSYFDKLVRDFRNAIETQSQRARSLVVEQDGEAPPEADDKIMKISQELYRIIIKPVEKYFSTKSDKVYIVYDRMLPLIPYQVLHDGKQYMAEKYTLVYAPSVSVLKLCMERRHPMGGKMLALGNPNLHNPDYNLAYAEEEVKTLAGIFPDSQILLGDDATETAVNLLSSDADILHFACHGVIDEDDPMKSHLRLAPDKNSDGYLTAEKIMDLHLQASLVTLSACDSGRGRILQGGEILGLTRAWMYAGAPSVLASLWKVDDRATSRLMTAFYENLKTHDKAKSLQLAQLDMIKEGLSPFYWAAFCLYGDYQ